jgi:general secretion pathway protein K
MKTMNRVSTNQQRGAVIIIVLWTAVLLTVLVTAMAGKVRLSASTVIHNYEASAEWAGLMGSLSKAEAQLMLEMMPRPVTEEGDEEQDRYREPRYRFNGQALQLYYPGSEDFMVRIFDHGGKINLNGIDRRVLQSYIEHWLGGPEEADPDQVEELIWTWVDWTDLNDQPSFASGAERDYYESLEPGFVPRNYRELDTVEEILHIRGFAELLEGVNVDAAFTIYGNHSAINLNLATRDALQLIPGMTDAIIEDIIAYREVEDIDSQLEIAELIPFENLQLMQQLVGYSTTTPYFSIFVYPRPESLQDSSRIIFEDGEFINPDPVRQAWSEIVEVRGFRNLPRVLKIDPYGRLPDTSPARLLEQDRPIDVPGS